MLGQLMEKEIREQPEVLARGAEVYAATLRDGLAGKSFDMVLLAARAGLETHRDTIAILHMLGSTDVQVARLFQRRIALDTMGGGVIGTLAAMLAIWALTAQMAELGSELVAGATLTRGDWLLLALLPALFALVATVAARIAVLGRLRLVQ